MALAEHRDPPTVAVLRGDAAALMPWQRALAPHIRAGRPGLLRGSALRRDLPSALDKPLRPALSTPGSAAALVVLPRSASCDVAADWRESRSKRPAKGFRIAGALRSTHRREERMYPMKKILIAIAALAGIFAGGAANALSMRPRPSSWRRSTTAWPVMPRTRSWSARPTRRSPRSTRATRRPRPN